MPIDRVVLKSLREPKNWNSSGRIWKTEKPLKIWSHNVREGSEKISPCRQQKSHWLEIFGDHFFCSIKFWKKNTFVSNLCHVKLQPHTLQQWSTTLLSYIVRRTKNTRKQIKMRLQLMIDEFNGNSFTM